MCPLSRAHINKDAWSFFYFACWEPGTHHPLLKGQPPCIYKSVWTTKAGGWAQHQTLCFRTTQETPIVRQWGRVTNFTLSFLLSPAVSSNAPLMWEIKKSECVNISLRPTTLIYFLSFFSLPPQFFLTEPLPWESRAWPFCTTTTLPPTCCHHAFCRVFVCLCRPTTGLASPCVCAWVCALKAHH